MTSPAPDRHLPGAGAGTALLVGLVVGGIGVGLAIAVTAGGGTDGAIFIGIFTLPLTLGAGFAAWRAILGAWLIGGVGRAAIRSRGDTERFREEMRERLTDVRRKGVAALPGTWVFVLAAILVGAAGGLLMGLAARDQGLSAGFLLVGATIGYGLLLRRLARTGRILFPE